MAISQIDVEWLPKFVRDISVATWVVGSDGYAMGVPEWTALTGQTALEVEGDGWMNSIHPADEPRVRAAWQTAVTHQTPYNTDYRLRCADGIYRWFNARGLPVLDTDGNVEKWFGVILSIPGSSRFGRSDAAAVANPADKFDDITSCALRAARALLNWPAERLASEAGLSRSTVRRLEDDAGEVASRRSSVRKILNVLTRERIGCFGQDGTITGVGLDKAGVGVDAGLVGVSVS